MLKGIRYNLYLFLGALLFLGSFTTAQASDTPGDDYIAEYESVLYSTDSGLDSIEVNALAQTPDGYLWAGSYSGLYQYDGSTFRPVKLTEEIKNVTVLFSDYAGRLWIGTNDRGVICHDPSDGSLTFFSTADGLSSNAIRSIVEDSNHNIYVGTVSDLSVISPNKRVTTYDSLENISCVTSLAASPDGILAGVTNSGIAFFMKDGALIGTRRFGKTENIYFTSICANEDNTFLLGTSSEQQYKAMLRESSIMIESYAHTPDTSSINYILPDSIHGGHFICGETGHGHLDSVGNYTSLDTEDFQSSICSALIDHQGNLWFASNKHGISKRSKNPFTNIFKKAKLSNRVANSILESSGDLYIGCDEGLLVLDSKTYQPKNYDFISRFHNVRIRHIMEDKDKNLWFSTYGSDGLVCVKPDHSISIFHESNGTLGGRFRSSLQLSDGRIVAASSTGLTFIKDWKVEKTLGEKDGLSSAQILCLMELEDGSILAGSDGNGIYVIQNDKVVDNIGIEDSLSSLVVLRIIKCSSGYLYVTSDAIYYDKDGFITKLDQFPYSNNYDIHITKSGNAWVNSSAGIYIVKEKDLLANRKYDYTLLNQSRGLDTNLTANAWNYMTKSEDLYLCCSNGIRKISIPNYNNFNNQYTLAINNIRVDNTTDLVEENGVYRIPANANRIDIRPAVLNYTLSNPLVHMYLEGFDDSGVTIPQNELTEMSFTNLPYGDYTFHLQIIDETTGVPEKELKILLHKEAKSTERPWFIALCITLGCFVVILLTWLIARASSVSTIKRQYAEIRLAKENADSANKAKSQFLANMSHEIRTPINTILGMNELILRDAVAPQIREYASDIETASHSLLTIINDILDLSKIEAGKMHLIEQDYDTITLFSGLVDMLTLKGKEKSLETKIELDPDIPRMLYGDEVRLRQILLNLLSNAIKYTDSGSIRFRIRVLSKTETSVLMSFSVRDTGIGIRTEDLDRLFDTFQRVDEKKNAHIQGTGLGLNISSELLSLMGSSLSVESEYGVGSDFSFILKQNIVDATGIGNLVQASGTPTTAGPYTPTLYAPDARILVVDDNAMNLSVVEGLLRPTHIQLDTASSGPECLSMIETTYYDLIFMDHMMPDMDGIETLEHIRAMACPCKNTPVIVLTANAIVGSREQYIEHGFDDYLSKPITGSALESMIRLYLPESKCEELDEYIPPLEEAATITYPFTRIDAAEGLYFSGGQIDFYDTMLAMYEEQGEEKIQDLESAYAAGDLANYRLHTHSLKSTARSIGANELGTMAESLENAAKDEDLSYIEAHHSEVLTYFQEVLEEIREYMRKR
nr:response regulator [Eubacterium sp.]